MRTHCFISTRSLSAHGARWGWHTADENGVTRKHSDSEFDDFNACVDDARAHGYRHVEVPVLHWSVVAHGAQVPAQAPAEAMEDAPADLFDTEADQVDETE